ncbi:MAG: LD-carboxypeptidase [Pseudomonadota bacterium]
MQKMESERFRLKPGATIGVAAPAGPFDEDLFATGLSIIEGMGFKAHVDPRIAAKTAFLAGDDRQRADVLHALFENKGISAIICARGGYGSLRLLPLLDAPLISRNPKPVIGFSDITALLLFLSLRCGIPAIHGPVVTSLATSDAATLAGLEKLLSGAAIAIAADPADVLRPGIAAGPLIGGNLTTLNHLLATGFMPDLSGCILLLEDIHEAPYRLDRMLCQMRMAGCFDALAGLALGTFEYCGEPAHIRDVFLTHFERLSIPVMGGFPIGHGATNLAVPLGVPAVLDTGRATLSVDFSNQAGASTSHG